MELVHFTNRDGRTESLRPTHALQVAALLGKDLETRGDGFTARSGTLAEAARQVRDRYRCRTVRKELRRLGLLGVDGVADHSAIEVDCADAEVRQQMEHAATRA